MTTLRGIWPNMCLESEVRSPTLANAEILTNSAPEMYAPDIDQVIFGGNRMFQEAEPDQ